MSVTKIRSQKIERNLDYARAEDLIEQLHVFARQIGWEIFDILDVLKEKKADCLSITKEEPFHYFYARLSGKTIIISLQTSEKETEFRLPIEWLKK